MPEFAFGDILGYPLADDPDREFLFMALAPRVDYDTSGNAYPRALILRVPAGDVTWSVGDTTLHGVEEFELVEAAPVGLEPPPHSNGSKAQVFVDGKPVDVTNWSINIGVAQRRDATIAFAGTAPRIGEIIEIQMDGEVIGEFIVQTRSSSEVVEAHGVDPTTVRDWLLLP